MKMKDLLVLVADTQMKAAIEKLLMRERALGITKPSFDVFVHPERDPGVFRKCHDFLRPFQHLYRFALVLFDRDGCGSQDVVQILRQEVKNRLNESGWHGRNQVVVLDPELEVWVWADSTNVAKVLGVSRGELETILATYNRDANFKPINPKEAMEAVLKKSRLPRSSAIYSKLAATVSVKNCRDKSFGELKSTLLAWFSRKQ